MNVEREIAALIDLHSKSTNGIEQTYQGESKELSALQKRIRETFKGYQVYMKRTYNKLRVQIGKDTKRVSSAYVGEARKAALKPKQEVTVQTEFGELYRCPICNKMLPREAYGTRFGKTSTGATRDTRQSYCRKCLNSYTVWRHRYLRTHQLDRLTPGHGPSYPNEEFRAYRLAQLAEEETK